MASVTPLIRRLAPIAPPGGSDRRNFILTALIQGANPFDVIRDAPRETREVRPLEPSGVPAAASPVMPKPISSEVAANSGFTGGLSGGIRELIYDPMGSVFDGVASSKAYGGHGKHIHYAPRTPQQMLQAISLAQSLGLSVRENPYTDPVDPVHTKNSHHYSLFPGRYKGRQLGQAADISGDPAKLKALYARLAGA